MKKMILIMIIILTIIILIVIGLQFYYAYTIGTEYSKKYSEVFGSYNIEKVDRYLDENTLISYQGTSKTYAELRDNIVKAFGEKKYSMEQKSSYGHGNRKFINNIQEVGILTFVEYKEKLLEEVSMEIERIGLFSYRIRSLKCDGKFFGYLFFGIDE